MPKCHVFVVTHTSFLETARGLVVVARAPWRQANARHVTDELPRADDGVDTLLPRPSDPRRRPQGTPTHCRCASMHLFIPCRCGCVLPVRVSSASTLRAAACVPCTFVQCSTAAQSQFICPHRGYRPVATAAQCRAGYCGALRLPAVAFVCCHCMRQDTL